MQARGEGPGVCGGQAVTSWMEGDGSGVVGQDGREGMAKQESGGRAEEGLWPLMSAVAWVQRGPSGWKLNLNRWPCVHHAKQAVKQKGTYVEGELGLAGCMPAPPPDPNSCSVAGRTHLQRSLATCPQQLFCFSCCHVAGRAAPLQARDPCFFACALPNLGEAGRPNSSANTYASFH